MPLSREEAELIGNVVKKFETIIERQQSEIDLLKVQKSRDNYAQQARVDSEMLRQRGFSPEDIRHGEERMMKESVGDYGHAMRLGFFGEGRPFAYIPPDEMQLLEQGNDTGFERLAIQRALDVARGG